MEPVCSMPMASIQFPSYPRRSYPPEIAATPSSDQHQFLKERNLSIRSTMMVTGWLTACATCLGCAAQVTSSTPRSVIVNAGKPPTSAATAQGLADAECKKHGRYASMKGRPEYGGSNDYVFDCVQ
jgi:hypothetical protein